MLSVINKPFILSVVMLGVILLSVVNEPFMLSVDILGVIMLNVVMLNVVMLNVIMLNAVMLNDVAPINFVPGTICTNNFKQTGLLGKSLAGTPTGSCQKTRQCKTTF
jgi:hypothetical protein